MHSGLKYLTHELFSPSLQKPARIGRHLLSQNRFTSPCPIPSVNSHGPSLPFTVQIACAYLHQYSMSSSSLHRLRNLPHAAPSDTEPSPAPHNPTPQIRPQQSSACRTASTSPPSPTEFSEFLGYPHPIPQMHSHLPYPSDLLIPATFYLDFWILCLGFDFPAWGFAGACLLFTCPKVRWDKVR